MWLPVVGWCAVIFTLSSIPTLPSPKIIWWDFLLKKTAHVVEYALLYFLVFRALTGKEKQTGKSKYWLAFGFCLVYALSDEYHQSLVPGRHCKLMDVGFDSLGMLVSRFKLVESKIFQQLA